MFSRIMAWFFLDASSVLQAAVQHVAHQPFYLARGCLRHSDPSWAKTRRLRCYSLACAPTSAARVSWLLKPHCHGDLAAQTDRLGLGELSCRGGRRLGRGGPPMEAAAESPLVLSFLHLRVLLVLFPVWGVAGWRLLGTGIGHTACRPTGLSVLVGASTRRLLAVSLELFAPLSRVRCLMFQTFFILRTRTARPTPSRPGICSIQSAATFCAPSL